MRKMPSLQKLCDLIDGTLHGDPHYTIRSINSIDRASADEITFAATDNINTAAIKAGALIVRQNSTIHYPNLIKVDEPYQAFAILMQFFFPENRFGDSIHPQAFISDTAKLADKVSVGMFTYIGDQTTIGENSDIHPMVAIYNNVKIGRGCTIYANVTIRENVEIGDHVLIHPGTVIGADGFGFYRLRDRIPYKIPQRGKVIIGNHCEIGANCCIDRSTIENTIIEDHVKLDNMVQIGHNVTVGEGTTISALTGISGSVKIGKKVIMGGQVGIADHINIGEGVMIAGKTGITKDVPANTIISGSPHLEIRQWRKNYAIFRNLDKYIERIKNLEKKINQLEEK
jgi:UDP-3-O-[3-hydroxymyristoyl] glucosamine N-acyltransferase